MDILQRGYSMVFVKKSTFFSHFSFFEQKKPGRTSLLFTPGKLSSSKVNKTDILQRGQSWFLAKFHLLLICFFLSKQSKKETFFDILDRKESFLDHKKKVLKNSKKIDILQRGQSMVFVKKQTFLSYVFIFLSIERE